MITADQINEDIKRQALKFGKWVFENQWRYDRLEGTWNWIGSLSIELGVTDDELYEKFLKRDS